MITAAQWRTPKPGIPWALDNGAFSDWQVAKRENRPMDFNAKRFATCLRKVPATHRPDFAIAPDIPGDGARSLRHSWYWLRVWGLPHGWPWYFAVQDGMTEEDVREVACEVAGIAVGGTPAWKRKTLAKWAEIGPQLGLRVHALGIGGQVEDLLWLERLGVDSCDTTTFGLQGCYSRLDALDGAQRRITEHPEVES